MHVMNATTRGFRHAPKGRGTLGANAMRSLLLMCALLANIGVTVRAQSPNLTCLPDGIKTSDVVSVERRGPGQVTKRVTVGEKLKQLKARCRRGKLYSSRRRQIYFYRLTGCWGRPPSDYLDILQRQRDELEKLKRRYAVVTMTCNPGDDLIP